MSILVVIAAPDEAEALTHWGQLFASACNTDLLLLHVTRQREEKVLEYFCHEEQPSEEDEPTLHLAAKAWNKISGKKNDPAKIVLKRVFGPNPLQLVKSEIEKKGVELVVVAKHEKALELEEGGSLSQKIFESATCRTLLLRIDKERPEECKKILVPASGGPHARVALDLAEKVAEVAEGKITALYVQSDADDVSEELGKKFLQLHIGKKRLENNQRIDPRVVLADNVRSGIQEVASEGYDLILIGASNIGKIRKLLFGTVPFQLLEGEGSTDIGVIRSEQPLAKKFQLFIERWFDLVVPSVDRERRIELFQMLQSGSEWNFDFLTLITLSTAIATVGLIQNSTAVVIGAMLVAPLMTPLLSSGLALVQANIPLVRIASRSILFGFFTAFIVSFTIGVLVPLADLTPELLARGAPTILDLVIAFLSGIAAAHCMSRPGLSAALPGVAIAAALVPPIATVGVSLAGGDTAIAQGAVMLFSANVLAIILGAALSFYASGIRAKGDQSRGKKWARRLLLSLILAVAVLAIPLGSLFLSKIADSSAAHAGGSYTLSKELIERLDKKGAKIVKILRPAHEPWQLTVRVSAPALLSQRELKSIAKELKRKYLHTDKVKIETKLVAEL